MTELVDLVRELVTISAARVAKQYVGYVDQADIEQEIWVWCYGTTKHREETECEICGPDRKEHANEEQVRSWLESDELDYHLGAWRTKRQFDRVGQRYSRREKAAQEGYETQDEYFYSRGLVAELLPLAWAAVQPGAQVDGEKTSSGKDPAEGGDLAAMVRDIRAGLSYLSPQAWKLLTRRYGDGVDVEQMALEYECAVSTMYGRINRALDKIVDTLGGPSPYSEGQAPAG